MRASSLRPLCFLVTLLPLAATAQTSVPLGAPPPQLSPQAAYQDAMHPLQITRNNIANWSDTEIAAMNVAIAKAKAGCLARNPADYDAAALIDLARLCSLGQQWPSVVLAASRYIENDVAEPKPLLPDAYVAKTEALLRMKAEPTALASALTMLSTVPYTPDIGDCVDEAIGYMRFVHNADALTLAIKRQPLLLRALETTGAPAAAQPTTGAPPQPAVAPASFTAEALYRQGLLLPALQQLAAEPVAAKRSVSALDAALPLSLNSDDTLRIAQDRRRYALLGRPLPRLHPLASLSMPYDRPPALPVRGAITAMLLFPDWCAQCVRMGPRIPSTVFTVEKHSAYVYGLLAQTVPARKLDPGLTNTAFNPAYAASLMTETATVTVPLDTLNLFEATDFPLLLLTDAQGTLRVLEPVGAQDLDQGGEIDSAIALVGRNFSPPAPTSPTSHPAAAATATP